ncbi:hypothetical protein Tco_1419389 [Tanacetum coccineum]
MSSSGCTSMLCHSIVGSQLSMFSSLTCLSLALEDYVMDDSESHNRNLRAILTNGVVSCSTLSDQLFDLRLRPRLIAVDGWMGRNADIKDGVSVK